MYHSNLARGLAVTAVLLVVGINFQVANAGQHEYKPKAKVTPLLQGPLEGVENREVIIKRFDLPPGFVGGRHSHPGPVFVYVMAGELTVDVDGVGRQVFKAGKMYQEPIGRVMQGRNMSTAGPLTLIVFQVNEPGKPLMLKAK